MRVKHSVFVVPVLLLAGSVSALPAGDKYEDPDAPEVEAAARQALHQAAIRPIAAEVRDIISAPPVEKATPPETAAKSDTEE